MSPEAQFDMGVEQALAVLDSLVERKNMDHVYILGLHEARANIREGRARLGQKPAEDVDLEPLREAASALFVGPGDALVKDVRERLATEIMNLLWRHPKPRVAANQDV